MILCWQILLIARNQELRTNFGTGPSGNEEGSNEFRSRLAVKALGNVRQDGYGGPPDLVHKSPILRSGALASNCIYLLGQLACFLKDKKILKRFDPLSFGGHARLATSL